MKRVFILLPALALGGLLHTAQAETRYVTDSFKIPMRSGGSDTHRIVRMVASGTPLEVLEVSKDGYTKVRTADRAVGWVMTRELMDEAVPRERVLQLEGRVATLEEENQALRKENESVQAIRADLTKSNEELTKIRNTAAKTLAIDEENNQLKQEIARIQQNMAQLEQNSNELQGDNSRNWFLAGAGVVFGSLFLGLVLPLIPWRRKKRWDHF